MQVFELKNQATSLKDSVRLALTTNNLLIFTTVSYWSNLVL